MKNKLAPNKNSELQRIEVIGLNVGINNTVDMKYAHRHDEIELNFVEKGSIVYLFAGKPAPVEVSQLGLFWGVTPHRLVHAEPETRLHWATIPLPLFLQWDLSPALLRSIIQGEVVTNHNLLSAAQTEFYWRLFYQWDKDFHSDCPQEDLRRAVILELQALLHRLAFQTTETRSADKQLSVVKENRAEAKPDLPQIDKVEHMVRFIAGHYKSQLSIKEIAGAVDLHPNYAMRVFHKVYGISILTYLNHYRLAHAQRLLASTDQPIMDVAFESGISSVSRFYTIFKANCGVTPLEYRKFLNS